MHSVEKIIMDCEFSGRYRLDEARFRGGSERTKNQEMKI